MKSNSLLSSDASIAYKAYNKRSNPIVSISLKSLHTNLFATIPYQYAQKHRQSICFSNYATQITNTESILAEKLVFMKNHIDSHIS